MDDSKRNLKGSEKRDVFKRCHKDLRGDFYAMDVDLALISKKPPGIVAYLDYKASYDCISFSEAIQYNEWISIVPVYIVESDDPENGPFIIKRYLGADWKPNPPDVNWGEVVMLADWLEFEQWELDLRTEYRRRGGWRGNLRIGMNDG